MLPSTEALVAVLIAVALVAGTAKVFVEIAAVATRSVLLLPEAVVVFFESAMAVL